MMKVQKERKFKKEYIPVIVLALILILLLTLLVVVIMYEKKDYKFTSVVAIHQSMLQAYSKIKGVPTPVHSCPASSSEMRNQIAAADLKVAAAELRAAQSETDLDDLRQKLAETKGKHIAQIAQLESAHEKDLDWMKDEVRLWRRFAFLLLGVGLILLVCLVFYLGWDVAHPTSGLIRY